MAAATLPAPGTDLGPCADCSHTDCAATRYQAGSICGLCPEPIGYGRRFYNDPDVGLVHAACLEDTTAKALAEARRCQRCGNDPRYTPPDHPCNHERTPA